MKKIAVMKCGYTEPAKNNYLITYLGRFVLILFDFANIFHYRTSF